MKLKGFVLILATIAGIAFAGIGMAADTVCSDAWLGVYMMGQKMGYMHITTQKELYNGQDCYKIQSFLRTKMVLLGTNVQQDVNTLVYTDQRFSPLTMTMDQSSGGTRTVTEANFTRDSVDCKLKTLSNGKSEIVESTKKVPIPSGVSLVGDSMFALGQEKPEVGDKSKMYYFNPILLAIDPIEVEILRKESIDVGGTTYDTFVLKNSIGRMGDMTIWQTEAGEIVKTVAVMGLTMLKETPEEAVAGIDSDYKPAGDFAILTSVKANIDIPEAREVSKMTIKLSGNLDDRMGISDGRQSVRWLDPKGDDKVAEFIIKSTEFDPKDSARLPIEGKELEIYLEPTPFLQCDEPAIKAKAAEIAGREKSAYKIASDIREWIMSNMKPQADIGIARPAIDVLKMKVGVCRDYAVLFGAIARAAGIPTKIVAGIVYMNGNFYYHAWVESYVGEWVAFDATLKTDFVDATHIKLAEGDATNMFEMAPVFGTLKAEIVKFE